MKNFNYQKVLFLISLIVVTIITRSHSVDQWVHLPNATLALFFISRVYFSGAMTPTLLLATTGLMDFIMMQISGSTLCFTPAYGFLIPTYLSLWFAGGQLKNLDISTFKEAGHLILLLSISSTAAFIISTGSYHLLSGRNDEVPLMEQAINSMKYFPGYTGAAFIYVGFFIVCIKIKAAFNSLSGDKLPSNVNKA